jgi:hypothetical protein
MSATLAPHRQATQVLACDLEPGDVITGEGRIELVVTHVRNPVHGLTVAEYESAVGPGGRLLSSDASLVVQRLHEGSH